MLYEVITHFPWFVSLWLVGVILIGGVGSIHGAIFGSLFMVVVMEILQLIIMQFADTALGEKLFMDFLFVKEAAFGLAICAFMIFEPNVITSYSIHYTKLYESFQKDIEIYILFLTKWRAHYSYDDLCKIISTN